MKRLQRIIVGVDFSSCSEAALVCAAGLARASGAHVDAVHVIQPAVYDFAQPWMVPVLPSPADGAEIACRSWAEFGRSAPGRESIEFRTLVGSPQAELVRMAMHRPADMLVVGAFGHFDQSRGVGPTAATLARSSPCDVLIVRPGASGSSTPTSILAAIDFSQASLNAVEAALRLAALTDAKLRIVHAFLRPEFREPESSDSADWDAGVLHERFQEAVIEHLRRFTSVFEHEMKALRVRLEAFEHTRGERHDDAIIRAARDGGSDLVVLGTRGHGAGESLRQWFFGSTAERVLKEAQCSVLVVPPEEQSPDHAHAG